MNGFDIKETMAQIHISEEMKEGIIMNIQKQMKNGKKKTWNWKKATGIAAALVVTAGVISVPAQAFMESIVKDRMEHYPQEEIKELNEVVQNQQVLADGFSREYSDSEKARHKELWQEYKNGKFPEKTISQVADESAVTQGALCYVNATGVFYLPDEEMTDEELLEIIDFQHKMEYAVITANHKTQEEYDAEDKAEKARLEEKIRTEGGISGDQAVEIARKAMETDLGDRGKELELHYDDADGWDLCDITDWSEYSDRGEVAYFIQFDNVNSPNVKDLEDMASYHCVINAINGNILDAYEFVPGENWDVPVTYQH